MKCVDEWIIKVFFFFPCNYTWLPFTFNLNQSVSSLLLLERMTPKVEATLFSLWLAISKLYTLSLTFAFYRWACLLSSCSPLGDRQTHPPLNGSLSKKKKWNVESLSFCCLVFLFNRQAISHQSVLELVDRQKWQQTLSTFTALLITWPQLASIGSSYQSSAANKDRSHSKGQTLLRTTTFTWVIFSVS